MGQKCEGNCGLWALNEIIEKNGQLIKLCVCKEVTFYNIHTLDNLLLKFSDLYHPRKIHDEWSVARTTDTQ